MGDRKAEGTTVLNGGGEDLREMGREYLYFIKLAVTGGKWRAIVKTVTYGCHKQMNNLHLFKVDPVWSLGYSHPSTMAFDLPTIRIFTELL